MNIRENIRYRFPRKSLIFFWVFTYLVSGISLGNGPNMNNDPEGVKRSEIIKEAEKYLGKKYKSKISGQMMDCSGFTKFIMSKFNIKLTRSSVTQVKDGIRVKDVTMAQPGDILVFKGRNPRNNLPGHVGIVHHWSNDTLYFIHSSVQKGITIDHLRQPYYSKRFLQVRNVLAK